MLDPQHPSRRLRRTLWATAAFLMGFAVLLTVIVFTYLIPAMEAAKKADPAGRRQISAYSTLLLAVVLFVIGAGLLMTFRVHRFFFPSRYERPKEPKTEHVSAWQISGQRMGTPDAFDLEDSDEEERPAKDDDFD